MSQRFHGFSEPSLIQAIEDNTREFLLSLGRLGGGEERDEPDLQWSIGGAPIAYHNCVVHARLTTETVDEAIVASIQRFQFHHVPGSWHVRPSMCPQDLGERLVAHGFADGEQEPGMAVALQHLSEHISSPPGLAVERIHTDQQLQIWTQTLATGFGEGEIEANWVGALFIITIVPYNTSWSEAFKNFPSVLITISRPIIIFGQYLVVCDSSHNH